MQPERPYCAYIKCGKLIPPKTDLRGPPRKYCSSECRLSVNRGGDRPARSIACTVCGTVFERQLDVAGPPMVVCSDECRHESHKKSMRLSRRKARRKALGLPDNEVLSVTCKMCAKVFEVNIAGRTKVYCSDKCSKEGHRAVMRKSWHAAQARKKDLAGD